MSPVFARTWACLTAFINDDEVRMYRFSAGRLVKYPVQNLCGPSAYGKKSSSLSGQVT